MASFAINGAEKERAFFGLVFVDKDSGDCDMLMGMSQDDLVNGTFCTECTFTPMGSSLLFLLTRVCEQLVTINIVF